MKIKVLIVGDYFFRSGFIKNAMEKELDDLAKFDITTLDLPYPDEQLNLSKSTKIPSGMSWDANPKIDFNTYKIREHYGSPEYLINYIGDTEILIVHGAAVPREVINRGRNLKLICCLRGGIVNIDVRAAEKQGIQVISTPGKNAQAVAEMILGLLITHLRNAFIAMTFLQQGIWKSNYCNYDYAGLEIKGKTFGIVGFGRIGQILAKILEGFDCNTIIYDPFISSEIIEKYKVKLVDLNELLNRADFVSLCARLPKDSNVLIGKNELTLMKPSSILINTARGNLLDYRALYDALKSRALGGAILDVFGNENFGFYQKLINLPWVTATPHICGISQDTCKRGIDILIKKLRIYFLER